MKLNLLILVLSILHTSLISQITLTTANNFEVGYEYSSSFYNEQGITFDPGPAGANQIWDFSDINGSNTTSVTALDPSGLPSASNFPSADIGFYDMPTQSESFLSNTAEVQSFWGAKTGSGALIVYSDPQDILRFPYLMKRNMLMNS